MRRALTEEKLRYGRIRKSMMTVLKETYGEKTANRAKWRVNARLQNGYFNGKKINESISFGSIMTNSSEDL